MYFDEGMGFAYSSRDIEEKRLKKIYWGTFTAVELVSKWQLHPKLHHLRRDTKRTRNLFSLPRLQRGVLIIFLLGYTAWSIFWTPKWLSQCNVWCFETLITSARSNCVIMRFSNRQDDLQSQEVSNISPNTEWAYNLSEIASENLIHCNNWSFGCSKYQPLVTSQLS